MTTTPALFQLSQRKSPLPDLPTELLECLYSIEAPRLACLIYGPPGKEDYPKPCRNLFGDSRSLLPHEPRPIPPDLLAQLAVSPIINECRGAWINANKFPKNGGLYWHVNNETDARFKTWRAPKAQQEAMDGLRKALQSAVLVGQLGSSYAGLRGGEGEDKPCYSILAIRLMAHNQELGLHIDDPSSSGEALVGMSLTGETYGRGRSYQLLFEALGGSRQQDGVESSYDFPADGFMYTLSGELLEGYKHGTKGIPSLPRGRLLLTVALVRTADTPAPGLPIDLTGGPSSEEKEAGTRVHIGVVLVVVLLGCHTRSNETANTGNREDLQLFDSDRQRLRLGSNAASLFSSGAKCDWESIPLDRNYRRFGQARSAKEVRR